MKNIFCILCKSVDKITYDAYTNVLKDKNVVFISDFLPDYSANNVIHIDDQVCADNNYRKINTTIGEYTSWAKVFYYLKEHLLYDYYWIIEDDVYLNSTKIDQILENCDTLDDDFLYAGWYKDYSKGDKWHHWRWNMQYFEKENLKGSLNPIVRLSYKMMVLVYYERYIRNRFVLLEVMFASIVSKYNLKKTFIQHNEIDIFALYKNSVLKYNNKQHVMKEYAIVHPFKGWYKKKNQVA